MAPPTPPLVPGLYHRYEPWSIHCCVKGTPSAPSHPPPHFPSMLCHQSRPLRRRYPPACVFRRFRRSVEVIEGPWSTTAGWSPPKHDIVPCHDPSLAPAHGLTHTTHTPISRTHLTHPISCTPSHATHLTHPSHALINAIVVRSIHTMPCARTRSLSSPLSRRVSRSTYLSAASLHASLHASLRSFSLTWVSIHAFLRASIRSVSPLAVRADRKQNFFFARRRADFLRRLFGAFQKIYYNNNLPTLLPRRKSGANDFLQRGPPASSIPAHGRQRRC